MTGTSGTTAPKSRSQAVNQEAERCVYMPSSAFAEQLGNTAMGCGFYEKYH
jgi:5-formyltetrahydrofolate cyclo-ligase